MTDKPSNQDLRSALDRLRAELDRLESGDDATRQEVGRLMSKLAADIEQHIGTAGAAPQRQTLSDNISDTIRRFEVEHPALTAYLGEIAAALG